MGVQSRILWCPEASLASGKGNPTSVVVVRACALHGYAAESASWVGVEEDILLIGVDDSFVTCLTLWYGGAPSTPCKASDSAEGLVKESRHRSERFLRRAPVGIGRIACRTAGERVPLQARTEIRSRARRRRESRGVGSASCIGYACGTRGWAVRRPLLTLLCVNSGNASHSPSLSLSQYTKYIHTRADIYWGAILSYELDCSSTVPRINVDVTLRDICTNFIGTLLIPNQYQN